MKKFIAPISRHLWWVSLLLASGCFSTLAIDNAAELPDSEVAIVRGYNPFTLFYGRFLNIYRVDDQPSTGFFLGHSDVARVTPGRHVFLVGEDVEYNSHHDGRRGRMCVFELGTKAGHTYQLKSGTWGHKDPPDGIDAFPDAINADVKVDGEVVDTLRISVECLSGGRDWCKVDTDCVAVDVEREVICDLFSDEEDSEGVCRFANFEPLAE